MNTQHGFQRIGFSAATGLGVERLDQAQQTRPGHDLIHLGEEAFAACLLALAGVFEIGKAHLAHRRLGSGGQAYFSTFENLFGDSLGNSELADLVDVVNSDAWSAQERLIMLFAVMTGARKQTVLTLRAKHIQKLMDSKLQPDGTYILKAGPGTGIDTKNSKEQILYVPKQLAIDLLTYVSSPHARKRRQGFQSAYAASFEGLDPIPEDDMYVFISEQCNCYYMAKSDPRYRYVKSRPLGAVTNNLKAKLLKSVSADFSKDFTYHWLRATFAFQLYQLLVPRLKDGSLQPGDEIAIIQSRLHHERRETTENYLKLFTMIPEKVRAQESYEGALFKFSSYSDMIMGKAQCSKG